MQQGMPKWRQLAMFRVWQNLVVYGLVVVVGARGGAISQRPFLADDVCTDYQGLDSCSGTEVSYPDSVNERKWQTPPRGDPSYVSDAFQDYRDLQAFAQVDYNPERTQATVRIISFLREEKYRDSILFQFGSGAFVGQSEWKVASDEDSNISDSTTLSNDGKGLVVTVWVPGSPFNSTLILDPIYFTWQSVPVDAPYSQRGQRGAIVELFGWPYDDIALECEQLGKAGYMGVKVFPASEHVETDIYLQNGELNPWFFMYQPVSYRLHSRSGSRDQLRKMIQTCRGHGVRVYADAVINHMTGGGNDVQEHRRSDGSNCVRWGAKNSTAHSPYYTHSWTFGTNPSTGERPAMEYPAVPFSPADFHCERSVSDWNSAFQLNYGWLVGLSDLNTEREYVQDRIAAYLTDLIGIGFSGFRIDAAKHIRPQDLGVILGKLLNNLGGQTLPEDFISWLEVIIGGERMLLACDKSSSYNYYTLLDEALFANGLSADDVHKIKIWSSDYPKEHPICGEWILPASRFAIQNDDHDQQNDGSSSRDMQDKGSVLVKSKDVFAHRNFELLLFDRSDSDWNIKLLLSSYSFMSNGAQGCPDGKSDCQFYHGTETCRSVPYQKAYDANACGYSMAGIDGQGWKEGTYTRVHRDKSIIEAMRRWTRQPVATSNEQLGLSGSCR